MSNILEGIKLLVSGSDLSNEQAQNIMREIMSGETSESQLASYLTALRMKGESPEVIAGSAKIMREFANRINPTNSGNLVDTCGTGGDNANTFNISTLAAIVASGAGSAVAKHGNRSVSSKCGSADILEAFGVKIDLDPKEVEKVISDIGIGFMFAPKFHPAMKYAMPVRKSLAMRTIFNILGPLTNPASAKSHILGVFDKDLVEVMAKAMADLGAKQAFIVHSDPGIDEIVPISKIHVGEVNDGIVKMYTLGPSDFGIENMSMDMIKGGDLQANLKIAADILTNKDQDIKRKIVVINAAYAILSSGVADNIADAMKKAEESLTSGKALEKLKQLVEKTSGDLSKYNQIFG
jgi:anthranilate phosphoribosyltransferase